MSTIYRARIDSPFGPLLLCATESGLSGLYFVDQKDCPPLPDGPGVRADSLRPGSGEIDGVALRTLRPVPRTAGQGAKNGQKALFAGDAAAGGGLGGKEQAGGTDGNGPAELETDNAAKIELLQNDTSAGVVRLFESVRDQLGEYFLGRRKNFDFPLSLQGTPFQLKVWKALCQIPYGELASYGQLASRAGLGAGHGRAVGMAVGRNPVCIVVPCHRIVGSDRRLTGYTGGLERKVGLLQLEGFELA